MVAFALSMSVYKINIKDRKLSINHRLGDTARSNWIGRFDWIIGRLTNII